MLSGRIYYEDGILLDEGYYLICNEKNFLKKYMILSDKINMLGIIVKRDFITDFEIEGIEEKVRIKSTITLDDISKILDCNYLKQNPFNIFQMIIHFFKVVSVIDEELSISTFIKEEEMLREIKSIILQNIKFDTELIEKSLERELDESIEVINTYINNVLNITVKKLIVKLKLAVFIDKNCFDKGEHDIKKLMEELTIPNLKTLRYSLKTHYDLSIKDMKKLDNVEKEVI